MQEICLESLSEDPQQLSRHVNLLFQGQPENIYYYLQEQLWPHGV